MNEPTAEKPRAGRGLCLLSGGLDSSLAICVLRAQGVQVEAVVFESPFFSSRAARKAAQGLGIHLHVVDFTDDIMQLVQHPPHGYGGAMNPCIDCHARMIRRAGALLPELGFDFLATGEVLNQRPMSQNGRALRIVATDCGCADMLVRPLCAQRLPPSEPERRGLVDRSRLLALQGRSRKAQMELARQYGIREYPSPAGGCKLTEPGFCRKLRDLMDHEGPVERRLLLLLRTGRHLRLPGGAKCVVGRDRTDNETLVGAALPDDTRIWPLTVPGPTLLLPGNPSPSDVDLACGVCASYADHCADGAPVPVGVARRGTTEERTVIPLARESFREWML